MEAITGRCFCGAVRFRFTGSPVAIRACWCRDCQYLSSGNASVSAIIQTATFELAGDVCEHVSTADSGATMRRSFCPTCGTPLFSASATRPDMMAVRVGALDDRDACRPASVIWTVSASCWAPLDPALPASKRQPAPLPKA